MHYLWLCTHGIHNLYYLVCEVRDCILQNQSNSVVTSVHPKLVYSIGKMAAVARDHKVVQFLNMLLRFLSLSFNLRDFVVKINK